MLRVDHFKDPLDLKTFSKVASLYEGVHPIAPVLHEALVGSGVSNIFAVFDDHDGAIAGAGILRIPEAAVPIGSNINPLAWVVSDMITHPNYRRIGVGMLLLAHMEGVVTRNGGRIIYLYTDGSNYPAQCLYEKARFRRLRDQKDQAVYVKLVE